MGIWERLTSASAALLARPVQYIGGIIQATVNFEPDTGVVVEDGGQRPGQWNGRGRVIGGRERTVNSVLLQAALRRLGDEMSGARVLGVEDYPGIPWHEILGGMMRRYYLDGGWVLWFRPEMLPGSADATLTITLFSPQDLQAVDGATGLEVTTSYTYEGITIRAEELVIYTTPASPAAATARLRNPLTLEGRVIQTQTNATARAGKPRWWVRRNNKTRTSAAMDAQRAGAENQLAAEEAAFVAAVTSGEFVPLQEGEEIGAITLSADTQFGLLLNNLAQLYSADSGVPAPFLGSTDNLTFANIVQLTRSMHESVIQPRGRAFAAAIRAHIGADGQPLFPDFALDFSDFNSVIATEKERADLLDKRATAAQRLAGIEDDRALRLAGIEDDETSADARGS